jgi:transposase
MRMGRPPKGGALVEHLDASSEAKERARVIIGTLREELTVRDACEELGVGETRFHQLRDRFVLEGVRGLEPRFGGRPRKDEDDPRVGALLERVAQLEKELKAAELRAQIAQVLPRLLKEPGRAAPQGGRGKKR